MATPTLQTGTPVPKSLSDQLNDLRNSLTSLQRTIDNEIKPLAGRLSTLEKKVG